MRNRAEPRLLAVVLSLSVLLESPCASDSSTPSTKRLQDIREHALLLNTITSVDISYTMRSADESTDAIAPVSQHRLRAMGSMRCAENRHTVPLFSADLDLNHNVQIITNESLLVYYPNWALLEICRDEERMRTYGRKLLEDDILRWIGWRIREGDRGSSGQSQDAIGHLMSRTADEFVHVDEEINVVDGHECVVVVMPNERVWLDPTIGYAMRRREYRVEDHGYLAQVNTDFKRGQIWQEMSAEGLWYPTHISISVNLPSGLGGEKRLLDVSVDSVAVNSCQADDFLFEPPAGTLVSDRDTGESKVVQGRGCFLDKTIALAAKFMSIESRDQYCCQKSGYGLSLGLYAAGFLETVVAGFIVVRNQRRASVKTA